MRSMKHRKTLLILTGAPGTGKSHWARRVQQEFPDVELLSYDAIKEAHFDACGFEDRQEKDALNARALEAFYDALDAAMSRERTLLIEYPFNQSHRGRLEALIAAHGYHAITLLLYGDLEVLYQRGIRRDADSKRHPGHLLNRYHKGDSITPAADTAQDARLSLEEFIESCTRKDYDIRIGDCLAVDVTSLEEANAAADGILDQIAWLG